MQKLSALVKFSAHLGTSVSHDLFSQWINFLPDDKILALSKLKAIADNNFNVAQRYTFSLIGHKTLWVKEKNTGLYQHFLLFPHCFQCLLSKDHENQGLFGKGLNEFYGSKVL